MTSERTGARNGWGASALGPVSWWRRRRDSRRALTALRGRPWRETSWLVLDFETSGPRFPRARPVSVGWVPVVDGRAVLGGAGYTLVRHEGVVPGDAIAVHRLVPEDLAVAPPLAEVADTVGAVLAGRVLVAHGAAIEQAMLRRLGVRVRPLAVVDTAALWAGLARREGDAPDSGSKPNLTTLARRLGVPVHRPHHAFGDALTAAQVFLALATRLEAAGAGSVDDLLLMGRA